MKRIHRHVVLVIVVFCFAVSFFLLRELLPGIESWHIELTFVLIELVSVLAGIIIGIYGYVRWRRLPVELEQWHRQFKGRREMARCPRCGSLKIDFEELSPVPSPDSGKMKWKAVCYDCGQTWEIEK